MKNIVFLEEPYLLSWIKGHLGIDLREDEVAANTG
jgi:hypothetical protein